MIPGLFPNFQSFTHKLICLYFYVYIYIDQSWSDGRSLLAKMKKQMNNTTTKTGYAPNDVAECNGAKAKHWKKPKSRLKSVLVTAFWYSQEEVLHYFMVLLSVAVWQKTSSKHDDGVHSVAIVALIKSTHKNKSSKSSFGEKLIALLFFVLFIFCPSVSLPCFLSLLFWLM